DLVIFGLHCLERRICGHTGLQPGTDGPRTGARQLEEGRSPEALRVRDVDTVLRRQVIVEAKPRREPAEGASPGSAASFCCRRPRIQDRMAQPVPAASNCEHEAVGGKEDALGEIEAVLHIETRTLLRVDHPGTEHPQWTRRSWVSSSREGIVNT